MKKSIIITIILAAAFVHAATNDATRAASLAERRRLRGTHEQRLFGGYVTKPDSAKGKVVFLNAQKLVPTKELQPAFDQIRNTVHPDMSVLDVDTVKLINPKQDIVKAGGKIGVVLADSPDLPMLVMAPENGWAIVNVAALKDGKPDGFAHRARVELLRAFALVSGCAFMSRDPIVLWPHVIISEDLDAIPLEEYGIMARAQMEQVLPTHGVTPWKITTYEKACREGWAHSPTNKFEKRIWDKVHTIPANPIKIKYDGKKTEK